MARFVDTLEGNYFVLAFENDLEDYSSLGSDIFMERMKPAIQIVKLLKERGKYKAAEEILVIIKNHLKEEQKKGIKVEMDLLKL